MCFSHIIALYKKKKKSDFQICFRIGYSLLPWHPPGPAVPLAGWLKASAAGHSARQRPGLQRLFTEGGPERQPPGGLWGQDAQQSSAD